MPSAKSGTLAFADLRASGLVRPAAEKFAGAWLACFLVMTRSDVLQALSFEHVLRASICGTVGAAVAVVLLAQMDRTTNSVLAANVPAHPDSDVRWRYLRASVALSTSMGGAGGHSHGISVHCRRPLVCEAVG
jgi:hypothetical protein